MSSLLVLWMDTFCFPDLSGGSHRAISEGEVCSYITFEECAEPGWVLPSSGSEASLTSLLVLGRLFEHSQQGIATS